ncbi:MAG: hypothetical protein IJX02_08135 [Clostridia bacterium]|nr:hypothetical protein [Clostridia bacterium]
MSEFFSTFGGMSFVGFMVLIFFFGKELLKLKKENKQLHQDLEAIMQVVPTLSSEQLETLKQIELDKEEKTECQKL